MRERLTLGPLLFHWPADKRRDFYYRIADEAPIDTVYLGEVICSKRTPFFEAYYEDVTSRLRRAGKTVVFSSLAEVMLTRERKEVAGLCHNSLFEVEANDASALFHLKGEPHRVGQYLNTYNELSLAYLVKNGATHITVPVEMPAEALKVMGKTAKTMRVCLEVQVFGRMGLALSARCYHARAHGRVKDNCQFVCGQDPDGMALKTLTGQDFLCVNGIQTLSDSYLCLAHELHAMSKMGINHFRLSPHHVDMVGVARCFAEVLSGSTNPEEAENQLVAICGIREFTNGFYYGRAGNIKHRG